MNEHPRNQGTSSVDLALLFSMPVVIAILTALIIYFGAQSAAV